MRRKTVVLYLSPSDASCGRANQTSRSTEKPARCATNADGPILRRSLWPPSQSKIESIRASSIMVIDSGRTCSTIVSSSTFPY